MIPKKHHTVNFLRMMIGLGRSKIEMFGLDRKETIDIRINPSILFHLFSSGEKFFENIQNNEKTKSFLKQYNQNAENTIYINVGAWANIDDCVSITPQDSGIAKVEIDLIKYWKRIEEADVDNNGFLSSPQSRLGFVTAGIDELATLADLVDPMDDDQTVLVSVRKNCSYANVFDMFSEDAANKGSSAVKKMLGGAFGETPVEDVIASKVILGLNENPSSALNGNINCSNVDENALTSAAEKDSLRRIFMSFDDLFPGIAQDIRNIENLGVVSVEDPSQFYEDMFTGYYNAWANVWPEAWTHTQCYGFSKKFGDTYVILRKMGQYFMRELRFPIIKHVLSWGTIQEYNAPHLENFFEAKITEILKNAFFEADGSPKSIPVLDKKQMTTIRIDWNSDTFRPYASGVGRKKMCDSLLAVV